MPYRPLRTIQDGLLHLLEGLLWADRAWSVAARFPAEQPATSEFIDPSVDGAIIWCRVGLSVIPAECSGKQSAGQIKQFAGNVRFHAKRLIHIRNHLECFSFAFTPFAMFQPVNVTSFGKKDGARAVKNEPKW